MSDTIVKILGWETKGLRIPDWKIDTIINDENIALILMPSGMGKTTTLTLLRYSFFDYSKIVTKSDIEVLQSKDKKIKEGEFNLKLKINNSKIRIQTIFNFENYTMSYKTTTQATEGTIPGLKLPSELNKYIDQEYIEKTFFNLELVEDLFKSSHAERSVRKLYKLDYLSDIKNLLFNYLKEQQSKSKAKVSNEKINQLTLKISKIEKQIDLINQENNKNQLSYEKLLDEKRKLEKEQKAIGNKNIEIKNAIERATARQAECETALSKNYEIFFNKIKNPMNLNPEFRSKLNNFVKNLARLKIPKSVGESFFDDLIREEECVCGNHMNEQMIKKILQNKESILSEETWLILSNIKTKITNNNNLDFQDISMSLDDISNAKRDLNISINKKDQIETSIDDTKYQEIRERLINIGIEVRELEIKFQEYNEKPDKYNDDVDAKSIRKLQSLLEDTRAEYASATDTQKKNNQVNLLKNILNEVEDKTLREIIDELVKKINLEIPRVMPYEKILVKDINKKIELEGQEGASQGQLARIGYLFLITLLNRPNFNFPFVVDSPVTAMDDVSRKEIASTISDELKNQYIAFLLPTERDYFAEELQNKSKSKINFITAFNTFEKDSDHLVDQAIKCNIPTTEFKNGVVGYGADFFYKFRGINNNE